MITTSILYPSFDHFLVTCIIFFFPFSFSIEESHQFLLSSSLMKILEVPLNIDWLQESIWFYYLTLPCWLWCEHSSGRCSSSSETLELKGFFMKCLFSSWHLLPRKERLEFPGPLSRAGKVWDSWEWFDAVLASGSTIHNLPEGIGWALMAQGCLVTQDSCRLGRSRGENSPAHIQHFSHCHSKLILADLTSKSSQAFQFWRYVKA